MDPECSFLFQQRQYQQTFGLGRRTPTGRTEAGKSFDMTKLLSSLNKWSDERLKEIQAERKLLAEDYKKNRITKAQFDKEDEELRKKEIIAKRENTKATNRATQAYGNMSDDMTKFANTIKDSTEEFSKYGAGFEYLSNKNNDLIKINSGLIIIFILRPDR